MKRCKFCGKPVANGNLDFCSEKCLEEYKAQTKIIETEKPIAEVGEGTANVASAIERALLDPHYMRGLLWRKDKLEAIHKALQSGYNEETILRILMQGGLTRLTAKRLIADSKAVYG